jgi:hypothetical protein
LTRPTAVEAANDGHVYVAFEDGTVERAAFWMRRAAWSTCVDNAEGGDASMFACDAAFTEPGEVFDARTM